MKKSLIFTMCFAVSLFLAAGARAQSGAKQSPQVAPDSDLEKDSRHNLEVARHYFRTRKAYVAALQRCEEIIASNPAFSKIDEVLFMAGQSSLNLSQGKGRQKPNLYKPSGANPTPEEFRDMARDYFSQLVNSHSDSSFRAQAEDELKSLGGAKPKPLP